MPIPGTKLAVNNTQLLISSGIPYFDELVGGGLAVGTVNLIEEDTRGIYSKVMLQYFLAEGVVNVHTGYFGSLELNSSSVVCTLPAVIETEEEERKLTVQDRSDELKIAWRYQNVSNTDPKPSKTFGHFFDLTKIMSDAYMDKAEILYWSYSSRPTSLLYTFTNPAYHDLLESIKSIIDSGGFIIKSGSTNRNILRIALQSLGSPLWLPDTYMANSNTSSQMTDLENFLFCLRALIRNALAVVVLTIPGKIINSDTVNRCIHTSDIAVRLHSFAGTPLEENASLSDYHGFFYVTKLPAINTLVAKEIGATDFVFKLRRKKFVVEKLHLPPELGDSNEREQDDVVSVGCGSSTKHLLEF